MYITRKTFFYLLEYLSKTDVKEYFISTDVTKGLVITYPIGNPTKQITLSVDTDRITTTEVDTRTLICR